jgi:hypothetical protein
MSMQIEISQCRGRNVHVVLRGRAKGEANLSDSEVFARYINICRAFGEKTTTPPSMFEAALKVAGQAAVLSLVA